MGSLASCASLVCVRVLMRRHGTCTNSTLTLHKVYSSFVVLNYHLGSSLITCSALPSHTAVKWLVLSGNCTARDIARLRIVCVVRGISPLRGN